MTSLRCLELSARSAVKVSTGVRTIRNLSCEPAMGANERVAALRRARQRQARIEAATTRAVNAQTSLARVIQAKEMAIRRCDERVAAAEARSDSEAAELAQICGSAGAAAEILGWSVRDVRRTIKLERERRAGADSTDVRE